MVQQNIIQDRLQELLPVHYRNGNILMINADCMDVMKHIHDNEVELSCVDPPYGIGEDGGDKKRNRGYTKIVNLEKKQWDKEPPKQEYFDELFRVSKNQIIWGGNYFIDKIKTPKMGRIFWDKRIGGDFSDGELAWTSFDCALRMFSFSHVGDTRGGHDRQHPCQKPIPLYKWLLSRYAKPGDRILDTHGGSGSICIACHDLDFPLVWIELDKDYYTSAVKRYKTHASQQQLFTPSDVKQPDKQINLL